LGFSADEFLVRSSAAGFAASRCFEDSGATSTPHQAQIRRTTSSCYQLQDAHAARKTREGLFMGSLMPYLCHPLFAGHPKWSELAIGEPPQDQAPQSSPVTLHAKRREHKSSSGSPRTRFECTHCDSTQPWIAVPLAHTRGKMRVNIPLRCVLPRSPLRKSAVTFPVVLLKASLGDRGLPKGWGEDYRLWEENIPPCFGTRGPQSFPRLDHCRE